MGNARRKEKGFRCWRRNAHQGQLPHMLQINKPSAQSSHQHQVRRDISLSTGEGGIIMWGKWDKREKVKKKRN